MSPDNPTLAQQTYDQLPPYQWPQGKRCAFVVSVDVDEESPMLWRTRNGKVRNVAELEMRRFGLRMGIPRLLTLFAQHAIHASFFVPAAVAAANVGLLGTLVAHGHEIGLHGYFHEPVAELSPAENAMVLERSIEVFKRQTGCTPKGYRSPCWQYTEEMTNLLLSHDIEYDSSLMGYDHPYTIDGLTEIPVSWATDDAVSTLYVGDGSDTNAPWPARTVVNHWFDEVQAIFEAGSLATLTLHPWVFGSAARINLLDRFFQCLRDASRVSHRDIWQATAHEVAEFHTMSSNRSTFSVAMDVPAAPRYDIAFD